MEKTFGRVRLQAPGKWKQSLQRTQPSICPLDTFKRHFHFLALSVHQLKKKDRET